MGRAIHSVVRAGPRRESEIMGILHTLCERRPGPVPEGVGDCEGRGVRGGGGGRETKPTCAQIMR